MSLNDSHDGVYDVTIIGAGPTGLFAAFCACMRGMRTKVIERLPEPGGQLAVLYPDKYIFDAPGHCKIKARDLVKELYEQSFTFGQPAYCFEEYVTGLAPEGDDLVVTTNDGSHRSHTVIIAAGIGAFQPKRVPNATVDDNTPGIHYFVPDLEAFRDRRVMIVGGGDSAVDWALGLLGIAKDVTLIHRRDGFRAHEASVSELKSSRVNLKTFYEMKRVLGDGRVSGAVIYDNRTGVEEEIELDDMILALGFEADLGGLRTCGLQMNDQLRHIVVNPRMETNVPGVFAAGDVTELTYLEKAELPEAQQVYEGSHLSFPGVKYEERKERWGLIVMGYAQAAMAVNHAKHYVDPTSKLIPGHSSEHSTAPAAR